MNKELLDAFEAAQKAGDAAAAGGGVAEEDRCVDALKRLRRMSVSTKDLVATQVGKRVRSLTKHPKPRIQAVASDLFQFWKNIVIEETSKEGTKDRNSEDRKSLKIEASSKRSEIFNIEKTLKSGPSMTAIHLTSENIKAEKRASDDQVLTFGKVSRSETMKIEKAVKGESQTCERDNGGQTEMVERISKEEKPTSFSKKPSVPSGPPGPPKLTSMIKCNDPLRDKLRELLAEAFAKVSAEASVDSRDEVRNLVDGINVSDPIRIAVMVESAMFEKLGRSNGTHKVKYRSIMFNLKDAKNTDLRRRVLLGHVKPEKLINMTAEEMASDDRKLENRHIQEKALFDCERGGPPKATTDQFRCGRCGQRKCTYYQLQTRSADEPMTTFVTCVNCNNHWKFC